MQLLLTHLPDNSPIISNFRRQVYNQRVNWIFVFLTMFHFSTPLNFRGSRGSLLERFFLDFESNNIIFFKIIKLRCRDRKFPGLCTMITEINKVTSRGGYNEAIENIKCAGIKISSKNSSEIRIPVCVAAIILPVRTSPTKGRNTINLNSATSFRTAGTKGRRTFDVNTSISVF